MSMNGSLLTAYSDPGGGGGVSKPAAPVSTSALSTTTSSSTTSGPENHHVKDGSRHHRRTRRKPKGCCLYAHLNSLWSVWYGMLAAGAQGYLIIRCARRFLGFASMTWPGPQNPPLIELNSYLAMIGFAIFFLPFFVVSALFKIGNLANDGFKLGRHLSTCSADPPSALLGPTSSTHSSSSSGGALRSLWQHGGPTAPFLHLTTAFCLLMPKLMMEAKLIQVGVLPKDDIWRTDLDFLLQPRDRLVVLSFMTHPGNSSLFLGQSAASTPGNNLTNLTLLPTPQPLVTSTGSSGAEEDQVMDTHLSPALAIAAGLRAILYPEYPTGTSPGGWGVSAEYLNFAVALIVYAVRYPAVFWTTNKGFGTLFSCQLLANAVQQLVSFASFCILYKVQVVGIDQAVPLLRRHVSSDPPFLLNANVSLGLFVLSQILVIASSLVLYLYGYGRFQAFLNQERDRRVIMLRAGFSGGGGWVYFTHCASLCVLASLGVCQAPLLHDYTNLYRGTLDPTVLAGVAAGIGHLLLWVVVWLVFTAKRRWIFKLRVTVGRAAVRSARSVKLVTDVDLISSRRRSGEDSSAPLLVVGNGRTYTVSDGSPKKAILAVIQKTAMERKARQGQDSRGNSEDGEEQIYWLRPKLPSPKSNNDNDQRRANWFHRKLNSRNGVKHKVTFDDQLVGRKNKGKGANGIKSPKSKTAKTPVAPHKGLRQLSESEDDGDYATLRELPGMTMSQPPPPIPTNESAEDSVSEDNKLLDHVLCDDTVTYARTNRDLLNPRDYESTAAAIVTTNNVSAAVNNAEFAATVTVHNDPSTAQPLQGGSMTPRCFRRADSGIMPHDELTTPRSSESVSTEEGSSPPSSGGSRGPGGPGGGSGHSETSSGVHSNSSASEPPPQMPPLIPVNGVPSRRSTSVDDLPGVELPNGNCVGATGAGSNSWRSYSLQRNMTPPTEATPGVMCVQQQLLLQQQQPLLLPQHQQPQLLQQLQQQPLPLIPAQPPPILSPSLVSVPAQNGPSSTAIYSFGPGGYATKEVVMDSESTVVIRRNKATPGVAAVVPPPPPPPPLEPFGRSTNMRMTSFMEAGAASSSSATLPHYPTQQPPPTFPYPHCSTMPHTTNPAPQQTSLGSHHLIYPRPHTTIPTHHNGIRLFPAMPAKRYQVPQYQSIVKHSNINNNNNNHHRDSANFSIASSSGNESTCAQGSY